MRQATIRSHQSEDGVIIEVNLVVNWLCRCSRFLFILLGPKGKAKSYHEIGRAIATLMSDEVRRDFLIRCVVNAHSCIQPSLGHAPDEATY